MKKPLLASIVGTLVLVPISTLGFFQDKSTEPPSLRDLRVKAEGGDADAQTRLALRYDIGMGAIENDAEAVKWYRSAADQGNETAQYLLALMYRNGEGVPKNNVEAVKWFLRAALQGNAKAQTNLGVMYANGEGVPKNDAESYFWANLAAAQGIQEAKNNRDIIEERMTRDQIAEAQRRSAAWKPKKDL
jgi:uncharacterized protein